MDMQTKYKRILLTAFRGTSSEMLLKEFVKNIRDIEMFRERIINIRKCLEESVLSPSGGTVYRKVESVSKGVM